VPTPFSTTYRQSALRSLHLLLNLYVLYKKLLCMYVCNAAKSLSPLSIFIQLHWLLFNGTKFKLASLTYTVLHTCTPSYLAELLNLYVCAHTLRSYSSANLQVPRIKPSLIPTHSVLWHQQSGITHHKNHGFIPKASPNPFVPTYLNYF